MISQLFDEFYKALGDMTLGYSRNLRHVTLKKTSLLDGART